MVNKIIKCEDCQEMYYCEYTYLGGCTDGKQWNKKEKEKEKMRDDLEHGWIGTEDRESDEEEAVYTCEWCSEPIYAGEEYYNFNGERVCCECVKDCKRTAYD